MLFPKEVYPILGGVVVGGLVLAIIWSYFGDTIKEHFRNWKAKRRKAEQNTNRSADKQAEKTVRASITFPGVIVDRDEKPMPDTSSTNETIDLTAMHSFTLQDPLDNKIEFSRVSEMPNDLEFKEVRYSVPDAISRTGQMGFAVGQQLYNAAALAKMAPNGLFTATVNPAMLSHFAKDGTFTTMIHGAKGISSHAGFKAVPGLGGVNPIAIVTIAIQTMAMISGNYYLKHINDDLISIRGDLKEILVRMDEEKIGVLKNAQKILLQISGHETVTVQDLENIRKVKYDVGTVYEEYNTIFERKLAQLNSYQAKTEKIDNRMAGYYKVVEDFTSTAKICTVAYQIYMRAVLCEVFVAAKLDSQMPGLDDLIKDAINEYDTPFIGSRMNYSAIPFNAISHLENHQPFVESLFLSKAQMQRKKEEWLPAFNECVQTLNNCRADVRQVQKSKVLLENIRRDTTILLIPGEKGNAPLILIPANIAE